ncbi:MAG: restriction endonuclease subunit S [Dolichospermum sp.]
MKKVKLEKISKSISSGITPLRSNLEYWDDGNIPWLKTEQLGEKYIYDTSEKITDYALENTTIKLNPINTLCIAMYGEGRTRGNISILKSIMTTNQACCNIVIDEDKADYEYIYYYLKTQYHQLRSLSSGVRKNLNSNDIKNFEIRLPKDIITQKKIAAVLSSLDDKIELNNRINSELENLAKTIYDYWFVQFDFPDENGTPYKSSGGKMVYNQELKREIPAGWEVKLLGDIGKNIKNVIKQTDIDPEISYIGLEHIPRKKIALDTWSTAFDLASDKLSFTRRDILFGKLRPYFHKVGVAFISGVCSTDILVLNSKKESYFGLFLMVVSSDNFINYVNLATEGTRMPRTKWEFMKQYLLAVPKEDINQKFNDILKPLISQMENNTYQNQQLTQLRDWLLPMLMNGQITVK